MTKISLPTRSPLLTKEFIYGVATASFQIEGGSTHRLPCIWDTFCDTPGKIADNSNGHVACDHYNNWKQDIDLIESLGVDAYRLSISWPRVITKSGEFCFNTVMASPCANNKWWAALRPYCLPTLPGA